MESMSYSPKLWLVVEWLDNNSVFPTYGIASIDSLMCREVDISLNKIIYLRPKNKKKYQRAKIVDISRRYFFVLLHFILLNFHGY